MKIILATAIAALALLVAVLPAGAQAPPPPCSAAQQAGARTPLTFEEKGSTAPDKLITGRRYSAVVVEELGISDFGNVRDGSVAVTSPSVALSRTTRDGRTNYDFTAPRKSPVVMNLSWVIEERGNEANACTARAIATRPVEALKRVKLGKGRVIREFRTTDIFALPLSTPRPARKDVVSVLVRVRRGTKVPKPKGAATYTARLRPNAYGNFGKTTEKGLRKLRRLGIHGTLEGRGKGLSVAIYPDGNISFASRLRFAFSMEVRQSGRRIGGYRAAASCRRIQKRGYSVVRCSVSKAAQKP